MKYVQVNNNDIIEVVLRFSLLALNVSYAFSQVLLLLTLDR